MENDHTSIWYVLTTVGASSLRLDEDVCYLMNNHQSIIRVQQYGLSAPPNPPHLI